MELGISHAQSCLLITCSRVIVHSTTCTCMYFADTLELAWQQPSYTVSEAAGSIEVCVEVSGELERSVEIAISTDPGSATGKLPLYWHLCCPCALS